MNIVDDVSLFTLTVGKAPLHNLLESIKPVQKSEFEKLVAEKESEVRTYASSWFLISECFLITVYLCDFFQ